MYNHSIRIQCNTYWHAGTCILSACFISRHAIFGRSGPHGRGDCLAPLSAQCTSLSALVKRTATITQAGAGSQTLRSGNVAFNLCVAPLMSRMFASVKAITVKFLVWENTTCKEHHPLSWQARQIQNLPITAPLGDYAKNVIVEMTL